MSFGDMTITLHDVQYLLRISIQGTQLSSEGEKTYATQLATMLKIDGMRSGGSATKQVVFI